MKSRLAVVGLIVIGLAAVVGLAQVARAGQAAPAQAPAAAQQPTPPCGPNLTIKNVAKDSRCFELRTYVVQPGGAGSLDMLHQRFRQYTDGFFKKYGMTVIAYWQPLDKPDTLIYLLAYKDAAARDAAWKGFQSDPGWQQARKELNVTLKAEAVFMSATDYSPMK
jgi:hypothetical protein